MRILGLDLGDERTGVAISDPGGILATPLTVLASRNESVLIKEILNLVERHDVRCVVLGLPRRLSGELGKQAGRVTAFADSLSRQAKERNLDELDIQLWDERLSTKAARRLKGVNGTGTGRQHPGSKWQAANKGFSAKAGVDAIAAAFILQGFLDSCSPERSGES